MMVKLSTPMRLPQDTPLKDCNQNINLKTLIKVFYQEMRKKSEIMI